MLLFFVSYSTVPTAPNTLFSEGYKYYDYSVLGSKGNLGLPVSRVFRLASREYLTIEFPIGTDTLIPKMGIMTGLFFL